MKCVISQVNLLFILGERIYIFFQPHFSSTPSSASSSSPGSDTSLDLESEGACKDFDDIDTKLGWFEAGHLDALELDEFR